MTRKYRLIIDFEKKFARDMVSQYVEKGFESGDYGKCEMKEENIGTNLPKPECYGNYANCLAISNCECADGCKNLAKKNNELVPTT